MYQYETMVTTLQNDKPVRSTKTVAFNYSDMNINPQYIYRYSGGQIEYVNSQMSITYVVKSLSDSSHYCYVVVEIFTWYVKSLRAS